MDNNSIHFVQIGRVRDSHILLTAHMDKKMKDDQPELTKHAEALLEKQNAPTAQIKSKQETTKGCWFSFQDQNSVLYVMYTQA